MECHALERKWIRSRMNPFSFYLIFIFLLCIYCVFILWLLQWCGVVIPFHLFIRISLHFVSVRACVSIQFDKHGKISEISLK